MTILSVCQDAAKLMGLGSRAPSSLISSTDSFAVELLAVAKEAATAIAKDHDWRKFTTLKTQTGDATTTAFDLPADYDRMPVKAAIYLSSTSLPMCRIDDLDMWLENRLESFSGPNGEWIILGGQLNIYKGGAALASTESAKYYYQSNKIWVAADTTTTKADPTADTDVFRLSERILTLAIIWRWRAMKTLDYSEEMQTFEIAKAQEIARDKGSRMLRIGRVRVGSDARLAYPETIVDA